MTDFSTIISSRIGVAATQVAATIALLNEHATIPFIARYRKERTGSLDEVQISQIADEYHRFLELDERKVTILKTIEEQGILTEELRLRIEQCWESTELEDIYLPYKPHRKTRADLAREQGYEPLAKALFAQRREGDEAIRRLGNQAIRQRARRSITRCSRYYSRVDQPRRTCSTKHSPRVQLFGYHHH